MALLSVGAAIVSTIFVAGLVRRGRRQKRDEVMATGMATPRGGGGMLDVADGQRRAAGAVVVRFLDTVGANRWHVDHRTTYAPPVVGQ